MYILKGGHVGSGRLPVMTVVAHLWQSVADSATQLENHRSVADSVTQVDDHGEGSILGIKPLVALTPNKSADKVQ